MSAIYILILVSLLTATLFLAAFIWAVKSGQYDDTFTPAVRMLNDETPQKPDVNLRKSNKHQSI